MSAFVERLALLLNREIGSFFGPEECRAPVRAILAEMRVAVTDEMLHAGMISISVPDSAVKIAWQAMIDVALAPDGLKTASASPVDGD